MKYRVLLSILRILVYIKRALWWLGAAIVGLFGGLTAALWRGAGFVAYKTNYALKRLGFTRAGEWLTKREVFQAAIFLFLIVITLSHTRFTPDKDPVIANQRTVVFRLIAPDEVFTVEQVFADTQRPSENEIPTWQLDALRAGATNPGGTTPVVEHTITTVAGGLALAKPTLLPGTEAAAPTRTGVTEYTVVPGDSFGLIAQNFGVSVNTILWENNLTSRSVLRPGVVLRIPPTTGVMYTVKKGDTLKKIALLYDAKVDDITGFNNLRPDGTNLRLGSRIMVPNGIKPNTPSSIATRPVVTRPVASRVAAPPPSTALPSASGFIWPSGVHYVSQYFSSRHTALDIAGPWQTPSYAAADGVVEKAQCGWNGGYGCYVVIDHGNGFKTLYAHHSQLLVSAGDQVAQGQTIALMGNTGNVHGVTGIHMHFEIIVNGSRVNPLGYVRP